MIESSPLASLAEVARATYHKRPLVSGMRIDQRARMIARFRARQMALEPHTLEYKISACVVLALLYGGSVRTINRISHNLRVIDSMVRGYKVQS